MPPRRLRLLLLSSIIYHLRSKVALAADDPLPLKYFETIFANIIKASVALGGIILLFMIISGGFTWTTAGGDPKKLTQAQHILTFAIVGFILLVAAVLILQLITQFTGVDVSIFRVVQP